jgi:hypothetical protein
MWPALGVALRLSGTLFTSYAADLAFPPWFYIFCRHRASGRLGRWIGRSPILTATSIFAVGVVSELAQLYFPRIVTGTFDPLDIAAYALGLVACFIPDYLARRRREGTRLPCQPQGDTRMDPSG